MRATLPTALVALALAAPVTADENRTFQISVEGKPAGTFKVRVVEKDGTTECTMSTRVEVKALLGKYRYTLDSTETWKGGKLTTMRASCNDDGVKHEVKLAVDAESATLTVDGRASKVPAKVCPTSYWKLPPAGDLTLVDSDTGKLIPAKLEKVGTEKVRVLGADKEATKYRLNGKGLDITLWYDAGGRLVRESFVERRHQTVLELTEQTDK